MIVASRVAPVRAGGHPRGTVRSRTMSAYYATPGAVPPVATEQEQLAPVLVAFAGPAPQSRLTVAFRVILAIPQFIVVWALTIAAEVLAIIGWFAALFTGRLPDFV